MANPSPATIIANALLRTFQGRGFTVHVEHHCDESSMHRPHSIALVHCQ